MEKPLPLGVRTEPSIYGMLKPELSYIHSLGIRVMSIASHLLLMEKPLPLGVGMKAL